MVRTEVSRLRSLGQLVEFEAARSLDLLKAIDDTVFAVCQLRNRVDEFAGSASELLQALKRAEQPLDPDGSLLRVLESARDSVHDLYGKVAGQLDRVRQSPQVQPEDGLIEAYQRLLDSMAGAHNILNDLCWAIGEHDADFDEVLEGEFTSAEDLIKALRG
jgi:hypothetical protein